MFPPIRPSPTIPSCIDAGAIAVSSRSAQWNLSPVPLTDPSRVTRWRDQPGREPHFVAPDQLPGFVGPPRAARVGVRGWRVVEQRLQYPPGLLRPFLAREQGALADPRIVQQPLVRLGPP